MEKTFICVIDFLSIEIKWGDAMSAKMLVALVCLGQFNRIHFHYILTSVLNTESVATQ